MRCVAFVCLFTSCFVLLSLPFTLPGSIEHRAQVILYTLLMSDRYSQAVDAGLLFYMKSAHMLSVPGFLHEKRALIMKRNEVARYLTLNRAGATGTMPGWYNVMYVIDKLPKYFRSVCNLMEDFVANTSNTTQFSESHKAILF